MAGLSEAEFSARIIEVSEGAYALVGKADSIGGAPRDDSRQIAAESEMVFSNNGAITPPYDLEMLCLYHEHSVALRPSIDAYQTNIDGFGYQLEPIVNLDDPKQREALLEALGEKVEKDTGDNNAADGNPEETNAALEEKLKAIGKEMAVERDKIRQFFENCCEEYSFVKLRMITRQDLEVMGNAYWEVLRNRRGEISQFAYVPGFSVRLLKQDPTPVSVDRLVRRSDMQFEKLPRRRRFRRFVQVVEGRTVFFKEYGDPRLMSAQTGVYYGERDDDESRQKMLRIEETAVAATELKHFKIHSPRTPYGIPRWMGALISVLGSRLSEEVNYFYFNNKSIPPLAILVSGGRLNESSTQKIESYIETNIKGKNNFHRILVIEATGNTADKDAARMKIEIKPLMEAQQNDALFQKYDERNIDKVGGMFRMPRLLRGDIRDFNRSTALAALNFAETQVFNPIREEFDWEVNNEFFKDMQVRFWKFESRAPVTRDPVALSEMIRNLTNSHNLTPEEGRELAQDVFNRTFAKLDEEWTKQPIALTLANLGSGSGGELGKALKGAAEATDEQLIDRLAELKSVVDKMESEAVDGLIKRAFTSMDRQTITISPEEMRELVTPHETPAS